MGAVDSETRTPLGRLVNCSIKVVREVALKAWHQIAKLDDEVHLVEVCRVGTTGVNVALKTRGPQDPDYAEYEVMLGQWSPKQMAWGDLINMLVENTYGRLSACSAGNEYPEMLDAAWLECEWRGGLEYGYSYGAGRRALSAEEARRMIEDCPSKRHKGVRPVQGAEQSSVE